MKNAYRSAKAYIGVLLSVILAIVLGAWDQVFTPNRKFLTNVNSSWFESYGTHEDEQVPMLVDSGIPASTTGNDNRFLIYAISASTGNLVLCAANQRPFATVNNENVAAANASPIPYNDILASYVTPISIRGKKTTMIMRASGAITAGMKVYAVANGLVSMQPLTAGTYYEVGVSVTTTTASGDFLEVLPILPRPYTVIAAPTVGASVPTTGSTNSTPYGYTTSAQADDIVAAVNQLLVDVKAIQAGMIAADADGYQPPRPLITASATTPG